MNFGKKINPNFCIFFSWWPYLFAPKCTLAELPILTRDKIIFEKKIIKILFCKSFSLEKFTFFVRNIKLTLENRSSKKELTTKKNKRKFKFEPMN